MKWLGDLKHEARLQLLEHTRTTSPEQHNIFPTANTPPRDDSRHVRVHRLAYLAHLQVRHQVRRPILDATDATEHNPLTGGRYVGTLQSIDSETATVSLKDVQCHGTEGRKGNPAEEIPGSDVVYDGIVFRGSDVKDLTILAPPKENRPPQMPNDPAILGVRKSKHMTITRTMMKHIGC